MSDDSNDPDLTVDDEFVDDAGISLDQLSEAYAELIGQGDDPYQPAPQSGVLAGPPVDEEEQADDDSPEEAFQRDDDACEIAPASILEAMLFVGHPENEPLTSEQIAGHMRGVRTQEIGDLVAQLNGEYAAEDRPYEIVSDGAGYRLSLREELGALRDKFYGRVRQARLSQASVDVLAIVAYNQPQTRDEVDKLRGKPSGALLTQLVRRGLLRLEITGEKPRRRLYYTTDRFLRLFALDDLGDLPRSQGVGTMNFTEQEQRVQTICLLVLSAIAAGASLYWLRPVLLPFVLALFFVSGIGPVLEVIQRKMNVPRIGAVAVTFLLGIAVMFLVWTMVWLSVAQLLEGKDEYFARFQQLAARVERWMPEMPADARVGPAKKGRRADQAQPPGEEQDAGASPSSNDEDDGDADSEAAPGDPAAPDADSLSEPTGGGMAPPAPPKPPALTGDEFLKYIKNHVNEVFGKVTGKLLELLSSATIVLIFMFFLLLGGTAAVKRPSGVWADIESKIRRYIVAKTMISLVTGFVFGLVLWFFGIPLALVFGMLAFLLNFIPNIGPIIASLLPLPLIILHPELSPVEMAVAIGLSATVQFVSGNIVEPKLMGDSFDLHPVAILLTLMFWGMIWGIVGMFLATPITAAMKILFEKFERTRPLADLLAGRVEQFFDRAESAGE